MRETVPLEVCGECLAAVLYGHGDEWRVNALWLRFRGGLTISQNTQLMTFRACEACGSDTPGVRYGAIAVIRTGEDA